MKVARYKSHGGPEHIEVAEAPTPSPKAGELLVKVHASSVNPIDWKMPGGGFPFNIVRPALPYIPGFDLAGEVLTAAEGFTVGDRVFARKPGMKGGASAEFATCGAYAAAKIPEGMTWSEAAAIPLAALTALKALRDEARMSVTQAEGYRVLVLGASGGVGHFGVQISAAAGAHVTAVCSGRNADFARSLGAHETLDYTKTTDFNAGGSFDVILDCVGDSPSGRFTPWLSARGVYVSCLPGPGIFARQMLNTVIGRRRVRGVMMTPSGDDLRLLCGLFEQKKFRAHIDETFSLDRLGDAHRKSILGRVRGKLVVTVP